MSDTRPEISIIEKGIEEVYTPIRKVILTYWCSIFRVREMMFRVSNSLYTSNKYPSNYISPFFYFVISVFASLIITKAIAYAQENNLQLETIKAVVGYLSDYSLFEKILHIIPLIMIAKAIVKIFSFAFTPQIPIPKCMKEVSEKTKRSISKRVFENMVFFFLGSFTLTLTLLRLYQFTIFNLSNSDSGIDLQVIFTILLFIIVVQILAFINYDLRKPFINLKENESCEKIPSRKKIVEKLKEAVVFIKVFFHRKYKFLRNRSGWQWAFLIITLIILVPMVNKFALRLILTETGQLAYTSKLNLYGSNLNEKIDIIVKEDSGKLYLHSDCYIKNDNQTKVILNTNKPVLAWLNSTTFIEFKIHFLDSPIDSITVIPNNDIVKIKLYSEIDSTRFKNIINQKKVNINKNVELKMQYLPEEKVEKDYKQKAILKFKFQ